MTDQPGDDSVLDLGALGHNLRKLTEGSAEREAYLEELRQRVRSGQYKVDSEALARKLIEEAERQGAESHRPPDEADEEK